MATFIQIKKYCEAADFAMQAKQDVDGIQSGSVSEAIEGWDDLNYSILQNPEYADLVNDPSCGIKGTINQIIGDAKTYMEGVSLEIDKPNSSGYIPIYAGSASNGPDGISQNFTDTDPDSGELIQATLFEVVSNPTVNLMNVEGDAQWDNQNGRAIGLATDWAGYHTSSPLSFIDDPDSSGDGVEYTIAQGSATQWAPYLHTTGGDPSTLNNDVKF